MIREAHSSVDYCSSALIDLDKQKRIDEKAGYEQAQNIVCVQKYECKCYMLMVKKVIKMENDYASSYHDH